MHSSPIDSRWSKLLKILLLIALAALIIASLIPTSARAGWRDFWKGDDHDRVEGSGRLVTRTLDVEDFEGIRVEGLADVRIDFGDEFVVELEAEDNLIDLVRVEVRSGILVIRTDEEFDIETDEGFRFEITMPELNDIQVDGVGNIYATGVDTEKLSIALDGVGNVELEGRASRLDVEMDGVGDVELRDLIAEEAWVRVDGVGEVTLYVEERLDVAVDGMGSVRYYGDPPVVRDSVDGFGSIAAR